MASVGEWGSGMSFVRDWNNGESYAVVGLAMGSDQNITVGGVRNGRYADAVTGGVIDVGGGTHLLLRPGQLRRHLGAQRPGPHRRSWTVLAMNART